MLYAGSAAHTDTAQESSSPQIFSIHSIRSSLEKKTPKLGEWEIEV